MKSKTFFNIIPGEETCCILLYGDIGDSYGAVTSSQITHELMIAEATYKNIDIRINSIGGEVYTGIAIFNVKLILLSMLMVLQLRWQA